MIIWCDLGTVRNVIDPAILFKNGAFSVLQQQEKQMLARSRELTVKASSGPLK